MGLCEYEKLRQSQYVYFGSVLEICCESYRNEHLGSLNVTAMVLAKGYLAIHVFPEGVIINVTGF